ncbi:MAG: hypothetical protein XD63_0489 [Thermoanaerobacterales bacterium 50_218]|nr:MAG: hypothetical protein XD63_0489 [Thermoanaerobacterales bacterium 50_218]
MNIERLDESGFTFVEAIMALTIFAIVISAVALIYVTGYRSYYREQQQIEVQESLRIALDKMSRNIRQAVSVTVCGENGEELEDQTDGPWLEFSLSETESSGYRFDEEQQEIEEKVGGEWQPVASNVTDLNFRYDSESNTVAITVRGEKGNSGVIELSTKVHLRAT